MNILSILISAFFLINSINSFAEEIKDTKEIQIQKQLSKLEELDKMDDSTGIEKDNKTTFDKMYNLNSKGKTYLLLGNSTITINDKKVNSTTSAFGHSRTFEDGLTVGGEFSNKSASGMKLMNYSILVGKSYKEKSKRFYPEASIIVGKTNLKMSDLSADGIHYGVDSRLNIAEVTITNFFIGFRYKKEEIEQQNDLHHVDIYFGFGVSF